METGDNLNRELTGITPGRLRQRTSAKWTRYPDDVLPAWVAEMDFPLADPVRQALTEAIELGDCGYASPAESGLAEAFAGFAKRRLDWPVDPDSVTTSPDVVGAIISLLKVLVPPGGPVAINPPVYHPFFTVAAEAGRDLVEVPLLEGHRLDPEAIDAAFAGGVKALILCNPHNPTGRTARPVELEAIAESALRHGAWVISDEIHAPLTLPGAVHTPFLTLSEAAAERGIALISASKTFNIAGLMCAEIVTASDSAAAAVARLPSGATHCGHLGVIGSTTAFRDGDRWLDDVLAVIDHNRNLLADLLTERLPEAGYRPPEAGYLAWLDLRDAGLGDDPSVPILERGRLALSPGPEFGREGRGFARLNFGTTPDLLEQAVDRIGRAVHRA
ncbi:MAG: aminotransferase class I/II-fold pyridoxal phosphate-dependent enzyme [Solirubrobacterales bacterium]|nr:aminotransferase class I/II-fold pyridoxal phosphate-dependent enzyme [Solirubrobacterales bacterium]